MQAKSTYSNVQNIHYRSITPREFSYRLTSWAFVFRPLAGSPLHFNQNFNSSTFREAGVLPFREAPGISCSVSLALFEFVLIVG